MDFATATPQVIADAIGAELERPTHGSRIGPRFAPVERDGAERAARLIAEVL